MLDLTKILMALENERDEVLSGWGLSLIRSLGQVCIIISFPAMDGYPRQRTIQDLQPNGTFGLSAL